MTLVHLDQLQSKARAINNCGLRVPGGTEGVSLAAATRTVLAFRVDCHGHFGPPAFLLRDGSLKEAHTWGGSPAFPWSPWVGARCAGNGEPARAADIPLWRRGPNGLAQSPAPHLRRTAHSVI